MSTYRLNGKALNGMAAVNVSKENRHAARRVSDTYEAAQAFSPEAASLIINSPLANAVYAAFSLEVERNTILLSGGFDD